MRGHERGAAGGLDGLIRRAMGSAGLGGLGFCGGRRSPGEIAAARALRRGGAAGSGATAASGTGSGASGAGERGMSRRSFVRGAAACAAGLAGAAASGALTGCSRGDGPDELNVYWWSEYVPESLVEGFENEFGIKVNETIFSSNEDMLAKVRTENPGTYDLLMPSDYMVEALWNQGLLEPLDYSKLPNFKNIGEQYLDWSSDPGNRYSIPYMGNCTAIAVNRARVSAPIESFADLLEPDVDGKLVVLNDIREVMCLCASTVGLTGNEDDEESIARIREQALKLKRIVKLYNSDDSSQSLITGDCTIGAIWTAEIALAQRENPDIELVFPREGCTICTDNWCVPARARHYDNAMLFINYVMRPDVAALASDEYPYVQCNTEAIKLLPEEVQANPTENVPAEEFERGNLIGLLGPKTLRSYERIWTEMKG